MGGEENEHARPTRSSIYTGNRPHRLHTETYEYDSMSNTVPPAGEYLRAPVCCSECEEFWKALILEIDEKHTSRVPAGKASLIMAKGASGSVLQIKSTKHVTKERRFFSGLGCRNSTVREDAFPSLVGSKFHSSQPRASQISSNPTSIESGYRGHEYPLRKLNITTMRSNHVAPVDSNPTYTGPFVNQPSLSSISRQFEFQETLHRSAVGYNAYGASPKHDVISTPRRHGHDYKPRSAVYPQPLENSSSFTHTRSHQFSSNSSSANQTHVRGDRPHAPPAASLGRQDLKPIRTQIASSRRPEQDISHLSTPRRYAPIYNDISAGLQGAPYPSFVDSSQLKPFPRPTSSLYEKANSRAQPREYLSHPSTPRMYTPMSQTPRASPLPENRVEDYLHHNLPPTMPPTPGSRGRWEPQNYRELHIGCSPRGTSSPSPSPQPNNIFDLDKEHHPTLAQSSLQTPNPSPNPSADLADIPKLSRTSTIESSYTSLSIPRSDCSASSSELDQDSPPPSPRSKLARPGAFETKNHRPQDLLRKEADNLSRTSTSGSSLMEPIVLFTSHGCRSETDEDDDSAVSNPNYFKHIITNPNYIKHIIKPQAPAPPQLPKDLNNA